MTFRICDKCPIPHYENCPDCFGYGLHDGRPISASKAIDKTYPANWQPCPTCGSGPEGLPKVEAKAADSQDLADTLQRQQQAETTRKELRKVLFNRTGLDRLEAITDEEWREADGRDREVAQ